MRRVSVSRFLVLALAGMVVTLAGCGGKNLYMEQGTLEFESTTQQMEGDWTITSYLAGEEDKFKSTFGKASLSMDFLTRKAEWTFAARDAVVADKLITWRQKYPGIDVTEYKIVITGTWKVNDDGVSMVFNDDEEHELVIRGSGENFEGFYGWEVMKFETGKSAGDAVGARQGGLMGLAAGALAKQVTETSDFFVSMKGNYTFEFSDGNRTWLLCRKGAAYRVNTTDCNERLILKK
ncbi:hypothetical protein [Desulfurispira natronophila]|uniref:Lipoprotein n=1 Tax=Desulfurispira natronophila TaxID=682562 RepID=A0A7W7Y4Y6_9BACT|nr:hypothetical protein [Desulfurispira natronophila]MBB5022014.1 hypothetical protein [Desulfurispira natronophila]